MLHAALFNQGIRVWTVSQGNEHCGGNREANENQPVVGVLFLRVSGTQSQGHMENAEEEHDKLLLVENTNAFLIR